MPVSSTSIVPEEISQFSRYAEDWWNPEGKFKPLHRLNPVRLGYVLNQIYTHTRRKAESSLPLKGLKILDIGCGGGLITEPLARLGGGITGIDASEATIEVARRHARSSGLAIDYHMSSIEDLAKKAVRYDVVMALEVVEHVADSASFLKTLAGLLKPNGLAIMSTLNRTPKSFLLGIVAAEYVLEWVPRGTHQWSKFIRPSELVNKLEAAGLIAQDITGLIFNPFSREFELRPDDLEVNYMLAATKN